MPDLRHLRRPSGHLRLSSTLSDPRPVRVAVEIPTAADARSGVLAALRSDPSLSVTLVGAAAAIPTDLAAHERITLVDAEVIEPLPGEPVPGARQVRARRRWAPRVAAELLAAGAVEAAVLTSAPAVAAAALQFTSRLLPGATRPALAAVLDTGGARTVVVDAMPGRSGAAPDELAQAALSGVAAARALDPEGGRDGVALLRLPPGSADAERSRAVDLLVAAGVVASIRAAGDALTGEISVGVAEPGVLTSWLAGVADRRAGRVVGAQLLSGFPAVVVLPGGPSADDVATAVAVAATAVRGDLSGRQRQLLAALRTRRREAAGLSGATVALTGTSATAPAEPKTEGEEAW